MTNKPSKKPFTECMLNLIEFETKYYDTLYSMMDVAKSESDFVNAINTDEFKRLTQLRLNNLLALQQKKFGHFIKF